MFRHYLKIALRNLSRNKVFSIINILGLAVGMGVCLLIYQYIHFELSYDDFHKGAQNTFRLVSTAYQNEEQIGKGAESPYMLGVKGKEEIPDIRDAIRVHPQYGGAVVTNPETNDRFIELEMLYVDESFLEVFDFQLISGQPNTVLTGTSNLVITEEMANKYFDSKDPIGQILRISGEWAEQSYTVTGVLKSPPVNSHFKFDFLIPIKSLLENDQYKKSDGWSWHNFVTYIQVEGISNIPEVEKKYSQLFQNYKAKDWKASNRSVEIRLQPIQEIHLNSDGIGDPITANNGKLENIGIYSIIASFILIIAWINYVNLSTARAMQRAREVGIRKSIGAYKRQLINQFLLEAGLTNSISAIIAICLAYSLLPMLNHVLGLSLEFSVFGHLEFWTWFIVIISVGTLLSGAYPAFMLSSFKAISMLKTSGPIKNKRIGLRQGLIVFQFTTSILLMAGAFLVYNQIKYMKNSDHGMALDKILVLSGPKVGITRESIKSKLQTLKNQLKNHHSILEVAGSQNIPSRGHNWGDEWYRLGSTEQESETAKIVFIDHDFLETYNIDLLAGKPFPEERKFSRGVLINEATLKAFDISSPEEALSEKFITGEDTIEVSGVLRNYNWSSLKEDHAPYFFALFGESLDYFSLKINMTNIPETIAHAEKVYRELFPNDAFEYFFLEDEFNRQYQADLQFGKLIGAFTILAIFIACLGLFALISFSATLRIKEIGIRKVLGARVVHLMGLLSKEYLALLLLANVVALPAVWYLGRSWLDNYAFKIDLGVDLFLIPGLLLLAISILTVSYQTYATAKANPVDALRSE